LKRLPDRDSSRPKINKTYKDFLKSLSETERESFVKFGEEEAGKMPSPPRLTQKWIENNWEDLRSLWQKSPGKITHPKWGDDPRREEWLHYHKGVIEKSFTPNGTAFAATILD